MKVKLFCVPYAGGSATVFYKWSALLDSNIELVPIELPGRGTKSSEPFYENWEVATEDIYNFIIKNVGDDEYALFGHSMGSWLVFEVIDKINKSNNKKPIEVFFSGNTPPHVVVDDEKIHNLPDEEFAEKIIQLGDTPIEIFSDKELRDIFMPVLRSDYRLVECYTHPRKNLKIHGGINVLHGKKDMISEEKLAEWKVYATGKYNTVCFDGGHMFINENMDKVTQFINMTFR